VLISEEIKRICEMMGVDKINRPDIDGEMEEIQRVTQYLNSEGFHTNVSEVISSFDKSIEVTIPEYVWSNLENTESNQIEQGDMESVYKIADTYDKSNPDKLTEKLKDGSYERPLIVQFGDRYHLVAGNTRLSTASALGIKPKVFIGVLSGPPQKRKTPYRITVEGNI
jgi:hypothetical protein